MIKIVLVKYLIILMVACQSLLGQVCEELTTTSGQIHKYTNEYNYDTTLIRRCWTINVPEGKFVRLTVKKLLGFQDCSKQVLEVYTGDTNKKYTYCSDSIPLSFYNLIGLNSVKVVHVIDNSGRYFYNNRITTILNLSFEIVNILCTNKDSFRCSNVTCISSSSVCDKVFDCDDGQDEVGCERGVFTVYGIHESRNKAISTLKSRRTTSWGWRENTHRAIVGLYLAEYNSSKNSLEDKLMTKQLELRTSVALLRNETDPISHNELGMLVNSLLMICRDPRHFYGFDLVKLLKDQVKVSHKTAHPMAYLALCNADEPLGEADLEKLINIFNSSDEFLFLLDVQAVAVMVVSCMQNSEKYHLSNDSSIILHYLSTINRFKELQSKEGSFGNVYTSALVVQALLSSGHETSIDWDLDAAVKYLMSEVDSASVDFLTIYLTLPILNGKSLTDIAKYNCVKNQDLNADKSKDNIETKLGLKMRVQYSLYIGDNKDIVHSISVRVPENITAYEVMQVAEVVDPKYKFKLKWMSSKMYVYGISGITNDPEAGKFWILHLNSGKPNRTVSHYNEGPDELEMYDGGHLIMWYQTVPFRSTNTIT